MKITSFYPQFFTKNFEETVKLYCDSYGFIISHRGIYRGKRAWILQSFYGDRVSIIENPEEPEGFHSMHVNVDNIMEALDFYRDRGYVKENDISDTGSAYTCVLKSPDGERITLFQHIKKHLQKNI